MSESEAQQQTLFGDQLNEQLYIETTGRVIRPWKRMLDQIAAEYRLEIADDGIHVSCVDKSNVTMLDTHLYAAACESFDGEPVELGIVADRFGTVLQHARYGKSTDDPITITADSETIRTETHRDVGQTTATITEQAELIDSASVRESPDPLDLDLAATVEMDPETIIEVAKVLETDDKTHVELSSTPEQVVFEQDMDLNQRRVELDVSVSTATDGALFSADYIGDFATAVNNGYVDSLTLRWDDEMPLLVDFEREDMYEGTLMVAPRVSPDSHKV